MNQIFHSKKSPIMHIALFGMIISLTAVFSFGNNVSAESSDYMDIYLKGTMNYDIANDILVRVNKERSKAGLPSLKMDRKLSKSAAVRARECVIRYSHDRPIPSGWTTLIPPGYRHSGENLAIGYTTASKAVDAWMDSTTHRANILGSDYEAIGIGVFEYTNAQTGRKVYTYAQHFNNSYQGKYENNGIESSIYKVKADEDYYPIKLELDVNGNEVKPEIAMSPGEKKETIIKIRAGDIWEQKYIVAEPETLKWEVSDPQVAEITTGGTIIARGIGETTMAAVSSDESYKLTFDVLVRKSIYSANIDGIRPQHYTGNEIKPAVTVLDGEEKLVKGVDYDIVYSDNLYPGTAKIHVIGKGDYGDERIMYFSVYDDSSVVREGFFKKILRFFGWD